MAKKIVVLIGSLRAGSFNRRIAQAIEAAAAGRLVFEYAEIGDVPFFNQDLEAGPAPAPWERLRGQIRGADGVLFVTAEYNRSVPGVLKNALDVASRPYGQNSFAGKPASVVSASIGGIGGFGANHHLRQTLAFLDMRVMAQPEMYLGHVQNWFDEAGALQDAGAQKLLANFAGAFADWVGA